MGTLLVAVASASFLGSLHCIGMCGGLLGACVGCREVSRVTQFHYHSARGVVYLLLGAIAGVLGATLEITGRLASLQAVAAWLAGGALLGWGLFLLSRKQLSKFWQGRRRKTSAATASEGTQKFARPSWGARFTGWVLRAWPGVSPNARAWGLGLASALLPCGWLYSFVCVAAATASVASGMLVMGVFWLGTVPALAGVAWGVQTLAPRLRGALPLLLPWVWIVLGAITIVERDRLQLSRLFAEVPLHSSAPLEPSQEESDAAEKHSGDAALSQALDVVRDIDPAQPPCCVQPSDEEHVVEPRTEPRLPTPASAEASPVTMGGE